MKLSNIIILSSLVVGMGIFCSCEDFLDRKPLDEITPESYFNKEDQLASYAIKAYSYNDDANAFVFNTHNGWSIGTVKDDLHTDNMASTNASYDWWVPGYRRVPNKATESNGTSDYSFKAIRNCNYFFACTLKTYLKNHLKIIPHHHKLQTS